MVNSDKEGNKGFDARPGGLIWVRRRNGSWWPAQILDPVELPEASRTGTPVKLLGRDNANVDWYNLDKSKRVKSFHCKEYEDCIKRVQNLASVPSNKRNAKYARREDAILHALELENARLVGESEDVSKDVNTSGDHSQLGQEDSLCHVDSAGEKSKKVSANKGSKVAKRVRVLKDLGMGVALKRKKRRPLIKVMECASVVSPTGEDSSESKRNRSVVINNTTDKLSLDVPVTEEKNSGVSDEAISAGVEFHEVSPVKVNGAPGWCLKRKRNSRSRKLYLNVKTPASRSRRNVYDKPQQRVLPVRQSRFTANPKYDNSEYALNSQAASGLYDVEVEVETSCDPQHVPYISLVSNFTQRPIAGHPIQVQVVKEVENPKPDYDVKDVTPEKAGKRKGRGVAGRRLKRKRGSSRAVKQRSKSQKNGLLLKKTRKLSLLTGPHRLNQAKPKPGGHTLACIALTVVFSRISSVLNSGMQAPPCPSV